MRPGGMQVGIAWPKPGKAVTALLAANIVCYVLELLFLRANFTWVRDLWLSCSGVFDHGKIWQVVTYWFQHDPGGSGRGGVTHLLFNMVVLWMFGSPLERMWGSKRFLIGYFIFGLGGAALTLIVGLLSQTDALLPLIGDFWTKEHLGASGPIMGVTVALGLAFANQPMNLLFLGNIKGKTFILIMVAIELLVALSFDATSSTSHFGGMAAAFILCRGLWRPSRWRDLFRRNSLKRQQRRIEEELREIERKNTTPKGVRDPKDWN
jgi:membrane associated rhomboid family serine protease